METQENDSLEALWNDTNEISPELMELMVNAARAHGRANRTNRKGADSLPIILIMLLALLVGMLFGSQ